jgi:hypothetical protein
MTAPIVEPRLRQVKIWLRLLIVQFALVYSFTYDALNAPSLHHWIVLAVGLGMTAFFAFMWWTVR